jgi:YD repeat-containing protein
MPLGDSTLLNQADYAYDNAGLRSSLTTLARTTNYTYDGAAELTSAISPASTGLTADHFTYDLVGNRTSTSAAALGPFAYDAGDRLLSDAMFSYADDREGNLISRTAKTGGATTTYIWSAEHQLIEISYPDGSSAAHKYDHSDVCYVILRRNDEGSVCRLWGTSRGSFAGSG